MILACGLALPAAASDDFITLEPSPLKFPRRLGPLELAGEPHRFEPAAMGVGYKFSGNGMELTIYVYDAGLRDIPDSGESTQACGQADEAKSGIRQRDDRNVRLVSEQLARLGPGEWPRAREASFELEVDGTGILSYAWVTAAARHFIKLRFSLNAQLRDEASDARRAILDSLGTSMAPHLGPRTGEVEKPGVSMALNIDSKDLESSMLYLSMLSAIADKAPELMPICGGELVPDYATELAAFQGLAAMQGVSGDGFGKQTAAAEAAGFLDELVWVDLHREAWGSDPPAGLDTHGYAQWRKKNLKRFRRPELGSVIFNAPRPLPEEPAESP